MGATLYASDNTTPEQRTLRIGLYESIYACSAPIGSILSGYLVLSFGFYTIFLMSVIGNTIACVLLLTMIKENHLPKDIMQSDEGYDRKTTLPNQITNQDDRKSDAAVEHTTHSDDLYPRIVEIQTISDKIKKDKQRSDHKHYEESNLANDLSRADNKSNDKTNCYDQTNGKESGVRTTNTVNYAERLSDNTKKMLEDNHNKINAKENLTDSLNPFKICLHNFRILFKPRGSHRTTVALIMIFIIMVLGSSLAGSFKASKILTRLLQTYTCWSQLK